MIYVAGPVYPDGNSVSINLGCSSHYSPWQHRYSSRIPSCYPNFSHASSPPSNYSSNLFLWRNEIKKPERRRPLLRRHIKRSMDYLREFDSLSGFSAQGPVKEELFNPTVCISSYNIFFGLTRTAKLKKSLIRSISIMCLLKRK